VYVLQVHLFKSVSPGIVQTNAYRRMGILTWGFYSQYWFTGTIMSAEQTDLAPAFVPRAHYDNTANSKTGTTVYRF